MAPEGDTTVNGIVLSAPEAGAELTQQVAPGATVDLGNLMEQVTSLAKDGNNFILTFENGGKIILQDFFPADAPEGTPTESTATTEPTATDPALASAGPSLIIDGQEVPYDMFMANYGDSIEAAAGPATATAVAAGLAGSGIGSYADGAGNLIDGLSRLGKLGIISWEDADPYRVEDTGMEPSSISVSFDQALTLSASSVNESEESFSVFLRLSFPQPTATTITLNVSGNATFLNSLRGEDGYRADFELPNGFTLTQLPNGTWNITVVIPAGSTGIGLNFPLVDDHISELAPEAITITVVGIEGNVTGVGATGTITVTDDSSTHASHTGDNEIGVLDGPIVGVIDVTQQFVRATGPQDSHAREGHGASFDFQITLTDPHTLDEYTGFKGDNLLSQDLTIVLKPGLGDSATYGKDYEFNIDDLLSVAGVKSAEVNDNGTITIVLSGRVDENGVPYPPNSPIFNMNDVPNLIIKTEIIDDTESELTSEDLTVNVDYVWGNESSIGEGSGATIDPDNKYNLNGPVIHVGVNSIDESASVAEKLSPEDNSTGKITIDLRDKNDPNAHQTADEGIPMTITIGGGNSGATYGAGNPKEAGGNEDLRSDVDYYLSGNWEAGTDSEGNACLVGKITINMADGTTQEVDAYRYDDLTNNKTEIKFEMPTGGVSTEIGYTANDDLFETEPGKGSFEVSVTLTPKGTDDYGNDIAYGEATVNNPSGSGQSEWLTSTPETGNITEDARDGLNPADFDGPFVKLTGSEAINESGANSTASYKISLHDPLVGTAGDPFAAMEPVTVSVNISADSGTFKMSDLNFKDPAYFQNLAKHPNGTWKVEVKIVDGEGNETWTNMTIAADGKSATIDVVVPAGQSEANFSLPALDDYYGGGRGAANDPASASKNDSNDESFSLTITGVTGNEARVENGDVNAHGKVQTTITDDFSNAVNQYGTQDGPTVNVVIGKNLPDADQDGYKEVKENISHNLTLKLTNADGNAFKVDTDRVGYDAPAGNVLQEDLTVTLNFGGTAVTGGNANEGNNDYTVYLKGTSINLTTVKDYDIPLDNGYIVKIHSDGQGNLTVTVPAGTSIDASGNIVFPGNNNLSVSITNDASSEPGYHFNSQTGKIELTPGAANDTLEVKVTDTYGHESVTGKGDQVEIIDAAKYYLGIKEDATTAEGGDLAFTLQLYGTSSGGVNTATASGLKQDTLVQLKFSPKGDLTGDGASHTNLSGYENNPSSYQQDYDLDAIKVALQDQGYGVLDVRFVDANDPSQGILVTFNIPPTEWTDGQYKFDIPTIKDTITESDEYLNVDIIAVGGNDIFKHPTSSYTHKEGEITEGNLGVEISIIGTGTIYEDPNHGTSANNPNQTRPNSSYDANKDGQKDSVEGDAGNKWNTASYTVQIKTPDYEETASGDGLVDQAFTFKVNLVDGSANYGDDYQWSWQEAGIDPSTPSGLDALNAFLNLPDGVKVIGVENNGKTLKLEVSKDTKYEDIESGIKINVVAKDDSLSESSENYKVTVTSPSQEGHAQINDQHTQNTNILDDDHIQYKDGFQVGVGKTTVNESEGFVEIPIILYDNYGYAINLSSSNNGGEAISVKFGDGSTGTMYLPVGYTLSQNMTITLGFGSTNDTATGNKDYDANVTQYSFPNGYVWEVVDLPGGGQALQGYAKVELTDDHLSEGPEDFTVTIESVKNNESFPYQNTDPDAPGRISDKITITDDDTNPANPGNTIGQEGLKDGPTLINFDPTGKLVEPVDTNNPGNPDTGPRTAEYRMQFNQIASEPILVMLNLGGDATLGQDFSLGEGIYQVGSTLTDVQLAKLNSLIAGSDKYLKIEFDSDGHTIKSVTTTAADGTPTSHTNGYFVVVPKDFAEAKFTVNILHDNDEKTISQPGDVDRGNENIKFEITDIAGSEAWIADDNTHKVSDKPIADDMHGPVVSIAGDASVSYDGSSQSYGTANYKVSMSNTATEDVKVYIDIMDNREGLNGSRYESSGLAKDANGWYVIIPAGEKTAEFTITPNSGDFFYVKQGAVEGGEAQSGGGFIFTDIGGGTGGGGGHYVVNLGSDITVPEGDEGYTTPVGPSGTINIPESMVSSGNYEDCTITFVILGGSATNGTDYTIEQTITITAEQISKLVEAAKDADPNYKGGPVDITDHLKELVTVNGDNIIEGDENLTIGIVDVSNGTVGGHPTTNVTIIDDDEAYFLITPVATGDTDGDTIVREGGEMQFEIQLVDDHGNPLQLAEGIEVRVQINGGAGEGSDFTLKTDIVTIGADGKGYVTVNFPNDYLTEADKPINITVTEIVNSDLNSQTMLDKINLDGDITVGGETVSSNSGDATLRDDYTGNDPDRVYDDGPTVSIRPVGGSTLTEGTSMSFMIRVDMVPDEDVQVVLQLGGDIEQLKYVDQNGNDWTSGDKYLNLVDIKGNIIGKALLNDDGTCTVTLPKGQSQVLVQVKAGDDTITEADDKFTVKIKETHGGETEGHFDTSETTVTIKDNMNGPLVVLTANEPEITEEAGHAEFTIALQGRTGNGSTTSNGSARAADEDITITLQMNDSWMEATRQGGKVEYLGSDNQWHEVVVNTSNKFNVTVPAGDTGLNIRVTVNDNSELDGNLNLNMTVVGTQGGESAVVKGLSFANSRIGEDGYGITYSLDCTENSSASDSIITVTLNEVDLSTLKSITLYGQTFDPNGTLPEGYTVTQSGSKVVITSTIHANSNLDTNLTVNFKGDSNTANGYKEQMSITVGGSRVAGTVITDEAADSNTLDGPMVGLVLDSTHFSIPNTPEVTEGEQVNGKLVVQMPSLAGDAAVTSGNIVITLQVSQNPDGTYSKITVGGQEYTPNASTGKVEVTIANGTTIGAGGKIELDFSVNVPDNALAINPDLNIKVTDVSAPAYEAAGPDASTGNVTIGVKNEASASDGPAFAISNNAGGSAIEGETITFNLSSSNACWKEAKGSLQAEVEVSGLQPGDKVMDANGNTLFTEPATGGTGKCDVTVNISSTASSASGSLKVVPADLNNPVAGREVAVDVKDVVYKDGTNAGDSVFEKMSSTANSATIISNDGIQLSMQQANFNASSNELMFTIALAAVGGYSPAGGTLTEAVSFQMNLDGLSNAEKAALADQIDSLTDVSANYQSGEFTVTLEAGHAITGSLDFTVPVTPGADYNVSIANVTATNLAGSSVAAAHSSSTFTSIEGQAGEVEGTSGNDVIFALNGVDSTLLGGEGDDILIGGTGNTTLNGGLGDDTLIAGAGNDIMIGGAGENTFIWKADGLGGDDSIVDFKSTDTIDLRDLFSNFGDPKDLDGLLNAGHIKFDQNTDNEKAIDIKISSDDLNNGGSVEQIITVNFAEHDSQSYDELQAMLQLNILTNSN